MTNKKNTFEVIFWPCSEEYVKDVSIVDPAFEHLAGPGGPAGVNEIFAGIEVGRPNAWAVLEWSSLEDHHNFMNDDKAVPKFVKLFEPSAKDGQPKGTMIHAYWEVDEALPCLKAPFIELTKITPKNGVATVAIQALLDKYIAHMRNLTNQVVGATYGQVVEKPEQFILVIGWKSMEV
ncbi:hypothetical protein BJV78DRAFT_1202466 [Lactifluus subvellereus]|nr:hypothetical protein BJV78DRAFT_1202466 [Lactifluus subvellereus]